MLLKFSQVKLSSVGPSTIISLFKVFRIKQALKSTKMNNERKKLPQLPNVWTEWNLRNVWTVRISRIYRIGRIIHPEHLAKLVNLGSDKKDILRRTIGRFVPMFLNFQYSPTSECLNEVKSSECWIKNVRIRIYRIGWIIHLEHLANLVNLGADKRR